MFRISLRELFLLLLVVALGVGWYVDRSQLTRTLAQANRWRNVSGSLEYALKQLGFELEWNMEYGILVCGHNEGFQ
jgi:hypothetical protein